VVKIRATLASYLGHFKHASSLNLMRSLWRRYPWLAWLFHFNLESWKLEVCYLAPKGANFRQQILFFKRCYPYAKLQVAKGRVCLTILPDQRCSNAVIKRVNIVEQGFNHRGLRQRVVAEIYLF